jgi:hypothetical protein
MVACLEGIRPITSVTKTSNLPIQLVFGKSLWEEEDCRPDRAGQVYPVRQSHTYVLSQHMGLLVRVKKESKGECVRTGGCMTTGGTVLKRRPGINLQAFASSR